MSAPDSPTHQGPWSMPAKLLPVPKDFSCTGSGTRIDLRNKTIAQLRGLAAKHNSRQGIKEDPFQATLKGIPERAKLAPTSKAATTNSLGTLLPADSLYTKAWRSIKRQVKSGKGDAAAKRAEAAATAARLSKLQGKASSDPASRAARQSQQLIVPPEEVRWRSKLSAFLGRPVDVPQLAPGAPVLDMNKLFIEVMNRGGSAAVTAAGGWQEIAFDYQRDAELADPVYQVYQCYLHPLELDLPPGFRPARNIDHLDSRVQQRAGMGCRLASYEAVTYTADRASAAMKQITPLAAQLAAVPHAQQQDGDKVPSQLVCAARMLLHSAAAHPDVAVEQLVRTGSIAWLHKPSQDACIALIRRVQKKHSRADAHHDIIDDVVADIKKDSCELEAAVVHAGQARAVSVGPAHQGASAAAEQVPDSHTITQPSAAAAGSARDDEPAAKKTRLNTECPQAADTLLADQQLLGAAHWLLLSRRAVLSGPPGCNKPLLRLPRMAVKVSSNPGEGGGAASKTGAEVGSSGGEGAKKSFLGFTPKCGKCKTCLNPSMKKACVVNKERLAQGLAPTLPPTAN